MQGKRTHLFEGPAGSTLHHVGRHGRAPANPISVAPRQRPGPNDRLVDRCHVAETVDGKSARPGVADGPASDLRPRRTDRLPQRGGSQNIGKQDRRIQAEPPHGLRVTSAAARRVAEIETAGFRRTSGIRADNDRPAA